MAKRIVQLSPNITSGDAVSSDAFMMSEVLSRMGYAAETVCLSASEKVAGRVTLLRDFSEKPDDIFLYHMSIGSALSGYVIDSHVKRKLMVYHNITPHEYFDQTSELSRACKQGRIELRALRDVTDFAICDSPFNKEELDVLGYRETSVLPIVFDENACRSVPPDRAILEKYRDGWVNILFVGRIAPNKKQEDVVHSFHLYNKYINPKSRLFLVGGTVHSDRYMGALKRYVRENKIQNVIFSGRVSSREIAAYYTLADLFLCESEHEGFCVPLLEAFAFGVPVLAYSACAVPWTMGKSGVLFSEKNHAEIAELIHLITSNPELKEKILRRQRERLKDFSAEKTKKSFEELISPWLI